MESQSDNCPVMGQLEGTHKDHGIPAAGNSLLVQNFGRRTNTGASSWAWKGNVWNFGSLETEEYNSQEIFREMKMLLRVLGFFWS